MQIDWSDKFTELQKKSSYDVIEDLMQIDMGLLYADLVKVTDRDRPLGFLPRMALCYIGSPQAESFCERVLRAGGAIVTKERTLLSDREKEILTFLRINRSLMEFMRTHYNHLTLAELELNIK